MCVCVCCKVTNNMSFGFSKKGVSIYIYIYGLSKILILQILGILFTVNSTISPGTSSCYNVK